MMRGIAIALVIGGCSKPQPQPEPLPPPHVEHEPAQPVDNGAFAQPPALTADAQPSPPPPPQPPATPGPCVADANHCCRSDGKLVVPGGCQPDYPSNVQPATVRDTDGTCKRIECHLKCLPADARIATPSGDVAVSALHVGDVVWTATSGGTRVAAPIVRVTSHPVRDAHSVIEVTLADGRTFRASPEHPLVGRGTVGELHEGSLVDGSSVVRLRALPYTGATWDVLPAGATGMYWSDGVALGSTLR